MKVDRFVFEVIVTLWLPGSVASLGILLLAGVNWEQITAFLAWAKDSEFLATILLVGILTLLGVVMAAIHGVVEEVVLDRLAPRRLRISQTSFEKEWNA